MEGAATVSGGDLALAAEVFRRYDADGSGRLDRDELLAALRDLGLLSKVSASAAARTLAEMDKNGDGVVSWEEFRDAFARMARLKAQEQRTSRMHRAPPAVPPKAATDPRLKAAFAAAAAFGAAKGLSERAEKSDGLNSRQFQRACTAAALPVERAAVDIIFCVARKGSKVLSFPRFLEALALVSAEAGVALDTVLDCVRATAPTSAGSPCKDVDSKLPLSARARGRPRSAGPCPPLAGSSRPASPPLVTTAAWAAAVQSPVAEKVAPPAAPAAPAGGAAAAAEPPAGGPGYGGKLEQRVLGLQALLEFEEGDLDAILAHPDNSGSNAGGPSSGNGAPAVQPAAEAAAVEEGEGGQRAPGGPAAEHIQSNPTFQGGAEPGSDLAAFRLNLLTLLHQRCEATEAKCAALVATRAALTRELLAQAHSGAGAGDGAQAAAALAGMRGLEGRFAALDDQVMEAVAVCRQESRAAVAGLEARLAEQKKEQEAAQGRVNAALLAIAKRVGELTAAQGKQLAVSAAYHQQQTQQQAHPQQADAAPLAPSRRQLLAGAAAAAAAAVAPLPAGAEPTNVIDGQGQTFLVPLSAVSEFTAAQKQLLEYNLRTQRQNNAPLDFPAFVREGYDMTVVADGYVQSPDGLIYRDFVEGSGESPVDGQQVIFDYTAYNESAATIDSSYRKGQPAQTQLGIQGLIPGFELGIKSMKPGGKRRIVVPPELGPPVGPATFFSAKQYEVFDVELRSVKTCRRQTVGMFSSVVCE